MDRIAPCASGSRRLPLPRAAVILFALILVSGPALASCSAARDDTGSAPMGGGAMVSADEPPADAAAAWAASPAFVRATAETEEAYAFALFHPQVVRWMPCYCGCEGMGHRSNLDCFLKPGARVVFEEHASYCDICVKTALLAKKMYSEGKSLREIRQAVDQTFGGAAPGTPTDLPPA